MRRWLWIALAVFPVTVLPPRQAVAQDLRDPLFVAKVQRAFDDIFNLDYDRAEQELVALQKLYPAHPAPPLYLASIVWLRELAARQDLDLNHFASPGYFMSKSGQAMPPTRRKAFFDYIDQSEKLSRNILTSRPSDSDAMYFRAAADAIRASFMFTVDHNLKGAFASGKKAYQIDRRLIRENPGYYDAYMAVGVYEYIVGSLPWYIKWLVSVFGAGGSKEKGFEYLNLAVAKGQYVSREADVVRTVMMVREGRYAEALKNTEALARQFPRNYLFTLNVAQILEKMGNRDGAVSVYLQVLSRAEARVPNYTGIPLNVFRYRIAEKCFELGRRDIAEEEFRKSISDPATPDREVALSHLRLGQIFDLQGRRNQAMQQYQAVLQSPDYANSHFVAREFLKKPFRG